MKAKNLGLRMLRCKGTTYDRSRFPYNFLACSQEIVVVMNRLMPQLPPDTRVRLNDIKLHLLQTSGIRGLYEAANGKTIGEILTTYGVAQNDEAIIFGELDGLRYKLFPPAGYKTDTPDYSGESSSNGET